MEKMDEKKKKKGKKKNDEKKWEKMEKADSDRLLESLSWCLDKYVNGNVYHFNIHISYSWIIESMSVIRHFAW